MSQALYKSHFTKGTETLLGCFRLAFISAKYSILLVFMLTMYPSYSFSCLTHYICVFCRNEENKMKSKQFGQGLKNMCKEEVVVATTTLWS